MLNKIYGECYDCKEKIDLEDLLCPKCYVNENEEYADATLKNVKEEFIKTMTDNINCPGIHFAENSDNIVSGIYMGSIDQYAGLPAEKDFIEGFKFGLKESIDWLKVTMMDFGLNEKDGE